MRSNLSRMVRAAPMHGAAADDGAAAGEGAHAVGADLGVAVDDLNIVDADAELVGGELGEGRFQALAVGVDAGRDPDRALRVHAHRGAVEADRNREHALGELGQAVARSARCSWRSPMPTSRPWRRASACWARRSS